MLSLDCHATTMPYAFHTPPAVIPPDLYSVVPSVVERNPKDMVVVGDHWQISIVCHGRGVSPEGRVEKTQSLGLMRDTRVSLVSRKGRNRIHSRILGTTGSHCDGLIRYPRG